MKKIISFLLILVISFLSLEGITIAADKTTFTLEIENKILGTPHENKSLETTFYIQRFEGGQIVYYETINLRDDEKFVKKDLPFGEYSIQQYTGTNDYEFRGFGEDENNPEDFKEFTVNEENINSETGIYSIVSNYRRAKSGVLLLDAREESTGENMPDLKICVKNLETFEEETLTIEDASYRGAKVYPGLSEISILESSIPEGYKFVKISIFNLITGETQEINESKFNMDIKPTSEANPSRTWIDFIFIKTEDLYKVDFESNGGSLVPSITDIESGSKITNPEAPTKVGYKFKGWYKDNTTFLNAWDFATDTVTEDTVLYAKWEEDLYKVDFESNGGSLVPSITDIESGSKITNPEAPTKIGYKFKGWYKDNTTFLNAWDFATDTVTEDTVLYAKWEEDLYKVDFESNGGSLVPSITDIESGSKITSPESPTKVGYKFKGWYKDNTTFLNAWDFSTDTVTEDTVLYAKWKKIVSPIDPTDPTDPTKPTDPTDPTKPTDPIKPTDSIKPTNPTKPTTSTESNEEDNVKKLPRTGLASSGLEIMGVVMMGAGLLSIKKNRKENK